MTNERNQDPQDPTRDQPPPKQYATPRPGQSGDRGTDQKTPRIPDQVESSEGDDENQIAGSEGIRYDEDASTKGATGRSSSEKGSTPSNQRGAGSATQKPDAGSSQTSGSGSRQTPGSTGGGSPSGSGSGGRSNK
jgi:hypothetical protein